MFDEIVRDVQGHWGEEGLLHLEFILTASSTPVRATFGRADIGALSLWLKQDHPPSPAQIAARLVERWDRNTDLAEMAWGEKLADLERHIAAALQAASDQDLSIRPKTKHPAPPDEIAATTVEEWLTHENLSHLRVRGILSPDGKVIGPSAVTALEARIAVAIAAERAREGA